VQYRKLGKTNLDVSAICLGTMTWGQQNSEAEAFAQMDYAVENGVNFFDTAELYSIPPKAETYGSTERIIGNWLTSRGKRNDIILASKIAGPGPGWVDHIRQGQSRFNQQHITAALDDSLKRLQTDCIDLYQFHWPERHCNFFGQLGYTVNDDTFTPVAETLQVLKQQIDAGKIRYVGLSNETPWGAMEFLRISEQLGLPRIASIQNPYSLLNRTYEIGLAEVSWREQCGLLAYSPLGFGVLSGKYLDGAKPAGTRLSLFADYTRYTNPIALSATQDYVTLAQQHNLDAAQMALAYVNSRPFVTSTIIGATSQQQLQNNIDSIRLELPHELVQQIEAVHVQYPNPCP